MWSIDFKKKKINLINHFYLNSKGGPVKKIVFREQFSFVEFEDAESVAYCLALFDGVELFGDRLQLQPKINHQVNTNDESSVSSDDQC